MTFKCLFCCSTFALKRTKIRYFYYTNNWIRIRYMWLPLCWWFFWILLVKKTIEFLTYSQMNRRCQFSKFLKPINLLEFNDRIYLKLFIPTQSSGNILQVHWTIFLHSYDIQQTCKTFHFHIVVHDNRLTFRKLDRRKNRWEPDAHHCIIATNHIFFASKLRFALSQQWFV